MITRFRVSPVMTTSIPLHIKLCFPSLQNSPEIGEKQRRENRKVFSDTIPRKP